MNLANVFVSILGVTNIGKTTQVELLFDRLKKQGFLVEKIKYPIYEMRPTGPRINDYLRKGNPERLTPKEFQELNTQNKKDFERVLLDLIHASDVVIAEMYTGTSIAYGVGDGVPEEYLVDINKCLKKPTISILLDGDRFLDSVESDHYYENDLNKTHKIREVHLDLAIKNNWKVVDANQPKNIVNDKIFDLINPKLSFKRMDRIINNYYP